MINTKIASESMIAILNPKSNFLFPMTPMEVSLILINYILIAYKINMQRWSRMNDPSFFFCSSFFAYCSNWFNWAVVLDEALAQDFEGKLLRATISGADIDVSNHRSQSTVSDALREMGCFDWLELQQALLLLKDAVDHLQTLLYRFCIPQIDPLQRSDDG